MAIWEILEIEATSDTKAIKRAYAKKLKVTRPDEDPKGFQELHWAYKTALQHAEWTNSREPTAFGIDIDDSDFVSTNDAQDTSEVSDQEVQKSSDAFDEYRFLVTEVQKLLLGNDQTKIRSWTFLLNSPCILEDKFNWNLGLDILRLIRNHNLANLPSMHRLIGREVMTYLDSIFNWKNYQHQVYEILGNEYNALIDLIEEEDVTRDWQDSIRGGKKISYKKVKIKPINPKHFQKSDKSNGCLVFILIVLIVKFIVVISSNFTTNTPNTFPKSSEQNKNIQLINNNPVDMLGANPKEVTSSTTDTTTTEKPREYQCNYSKHDKLNLSSLCRPIDMEKLEQ